MSRLSRLAAGLILAVAVAPAARSADIDPILPAATESVFCINMRQIVDANLVKKYVLGQLKQAMQGNDVSKQLQDIGLDPLKDIDKVTIGSWGQEEDGNLVAVVRGRFDLEKMFAGAEKLAKTEGDKVKIVSDPKCKLIQFTFDQSPKPVFVTFADDKTIVAGLDQKTTVTAFETAKGGSTKPQLGKELTALVLKQDEKASLFACGLAPKDGVKLPPGGGGGIPGVDTAKLGEQLKGLKNYAMTLRLTDDVSMEFDAGMADAAAADEFGASLSQLIGTAKGFLPLISGQNPAMQPLVNEINSTLKSSVKGSDVTLSVRLSGDAIGKAAGSGD